MPILAKNKRATFDYELLEKIEAGLMLSGPEVKSARNGNINLKGAFITFEKDEAYLTNAHIGAYKYASIPDYDPTRKRKLLLSKKQIMMLSAKKATQGLTIVPVSVYTSGRLIKLEIAVAKGKKSYDKRQDLKKRDQNREIHRLLKG